MWPTRRDDNLTTFKHRMSRNLGSSGSWDHQACTGIALPFRNPGKHFFWPRIRLCVWQWLRKDGARPITLRLTLVRPCPVLDLFMLLGRGHWSLISEFQQTGIDLTSPIWCVPTLNPFLSNKCNRRNFKRKIVIIIIIQSGNNKNKYNLLHKVCRINRSQGQSAKTYQFSDN